MQPIKNRLTTYSKKTILYQTYMVNEDILDKTESILIQHFSKKFIKERGREWFKGDLKEMMSEIEIILELTSVKNWIVYTFIFT